MKERKGHGRPAPKRTSRDEIRVCGLHASQALFSRRFGDVGKVYLTEENLGPFAPWLKKCAAAKIGYRQVSPAELTRIAGTEHHEGICVLAPPPREYTLKGLLARLRHRRAPGAVIVLENVRNPHNLGAIARVAAHFGAAALILVGEAPTLSAAVFRTAEGGLEHLDLCRHSEGKEVVGALQKAGFAVAATSSHEAQGLFALQLPRKTAFFFGAEREGLGRWVLQNADLHVRIDGSGLMESLNVACAVTAILGEHARQHQLFGTQARHRKSRKMPGDPAGRSERRSRTTHQKKRKPGRPAGRDRR
jgi:TrmH RNA methyltransferase